MAQGKEISSGVNDNKNKISLPKTVALALAAGTLAFSLTGCNEEDTIAKSVETTTSVAELSGAETGVVTDAAAVTGSAEETTAAAGATTEEITAVVTEAETQPTTTEALDLAWDSPERIEGILNGYRQEIEEKGWIIVQDFETTFDQDRSGIWHSASIAHITPAGYHGQEAVGAMVQVEMSETDTNPVLYVQYPDYVRARTDKGFGNSIHYVLDVYPDITFGPPSYYDGK